MNIPKKKKTVNKTNYSPFLYQLLELQYRVIYYSLSDLATVQVLHRASQVAPVVKNLLANAGDVRGGFDPWVGMIPGGGHGNPLQYSCLENPMD